jgi:hypothetical protein
MAMYLVSQLFKVHMVNGVWQVEMHTTEPLVPYISPFEIEIDIAKLKR